MNKSQKIHITTESKDLDKYLHVKLEQDVDTLEFMSLKLDTKEVYNMFNADYGVIVGRVIANGGIGIPNAKISIFIPLDENDEDDGDITSIYPYKTPRDKNNNGKRYNLLPRVAKINPEDGTIQPKQPFGSLPIKEEFVTNSTYLEIYKKYYKYSTVTNDAGDYMIFGVPVGTQIVHMSCDITDIGKYSMNPAAMVTNLGYSPNLFTDNNTKIKSSTDLDDLPNIDTQEISVDIIPFWGDTENFEIGITRQDFRIRAELINTFTLFGSVFSDGDDSMWGDDFAPYNVLASELYRARKEEVTTAIGNKRISIVNEKIYYYPNTVTDEQINTGDIDTNNDIMVLDPTEYTSFKRDGDFVFVVNTNRRKIITDERGNEVVVANNYSAGVFTEFRGFVTFEITEDNLPMDFGGAIANNIDLTPFRYKIKIPQATSKGNSFNRLDDERTEAWRRNSFSFTGGSIYSIANFHGLVFNDADNDNAFNDGQFVDGFFASDEVNRGYDSPSWDLYWVTRIIQTNNVGSLTGNTAQQFPTNITNPTDSREYFGANWLNFTLHLPQVARANGSLNRINEMRSNTNYTIDPKSNHFFYDNTQEIAAGETNTKHFARSDLHFTDFIQVPKDILVDMINYTPNLKGFKFSNLPASVRAKITSYGGFKNGEDIVPFDSSGRLGGGGKINGDVNESIDTDYYFYKGLNTANCFEFLQELGLL